MGSRIAIKEADVAIIGGGPAGLSAAIKAKESGLEKVVIIERGENLGGVLISVSIMVLDYRILVKILPARNMPGG